MELKQALRIGSQPTSADDRMAMCENVLMRELIRMLVVPRHEMDKPITYAHHGDFVDRIYGMTEWELVSTAGLFLHECTEEGMSEEVWHACQGDYDLADAAASQVWDALIRIRDQAGELRASLG